MSDQISSAVVSEVISRAICFLSGKCSEYKGIDEQIARLEILRLKIKSAVEASEEFGINIEALYEWQEKLKEAFCEADEMLHSFMKDRKSLQEKQICTAEHGTSSHDRDRFMDGEGHDDGERENLAYLTSNLGEPATYQIDMEAKLHLTTTLKHLFYRVFGLMNHKTDSPWPAILERFSAFARVLDQKTSNLLNPLMMVDKYLENDEKVSKLIKTVEKLEKTAGDIGDFIALLKLQSKRKMSRKRKRSARTRRHHHRRFFLVISLKLPTHALLCHEEDYHLLVIKLFAVDAVSYLLEFLTCDFLSDSYCEYLFN